MKRLRTFDFSLLLIVALISGIGAILIFSATAAELGEDRSGYWNKQLIWLGASLLIFLVVAVIPYKLIDAFSWLLYGASLASLVSVLLFAPVVSGSQRWLDLFEGFRIQPSEFAKISTILVLARFLSNPRRDMERILDVVKAFSIIMVPIILIFLQPDLGTSLVFFPMIFAMLYWSGLRPLTLFLIAAPVASLLASFHLVTFMIFMLLLLLIFYFSSISIGAAVFSFMINLGWDSSCHGHGTDWSPTS